MQRQFGTQPPNLILPIFLVINDCWDLLYPIFCRGEGGELASKKDFINTARLIAKESDEVVKMAKKVAEACTDKRMKRVSPQ